MRILFNKCMPIIFKHEGGYVWDPDDPGGETNMGICRLFYPNLDIKNLTKDKANAIYYYDYWLRAGIEGILQENAALQIFDMCVNARSKRHGFKKIIRIVQRLVGVDDDGIMGNVTRHAVNTYKGDFAHDFAHARKVYYEHRCEINPILSKYLVGWNRRVDSCKF